MNNSKFTALTAEEINSVEGGRITINPKVQEVLVKIAVWAIKYAPFVVC